LATLQTSLNEANQARKAAETALLDEKLAAKKRMSELKEQNRRIQAELTNTIKPSNISTAAVVEPEAPPQNLTPTSPTILQHDTSASANKKKKKKKKKVGAAAPTVSPQPEAEEQPAIITPVPAIAPVPETERLPPDNYALRLLEEYLSEIGKSLNTGPVGQELDDKVESLESKLSSFSVKMSLLLKQLEEANIDHETLTQRLREAENDIKSSREREDHLLENTRRLESTSEDVEQLRDMLRDVGSDLVEAKDKIKEIEQREATAKSTKSDLEGAIATLTKELNETRETAGIIEDVRSQAAIAESRAETLLKELNDSKAKLGAVESDLAKLNAELATVSVDKNDLTAKFADTQTKLRQIERSEKEARDRVASMQTSLVSKEREISAIRSELTNVQNFKNQLEESLRTSRQDISRLESERRELQQREQTARDESTRFQRDATMYRDKITSLELLRTTLTTERDTLTEEVQMKTAQLESTQSSMQNLREQTTEMGHRAREAKDRCEALDEELSEAHKLLSERAREAGTMRRLLDEAEGREAGRIKEAREKLEAAIEERDHLEEEITLLRRNNAEGSGELTKSLREKELAVKDLATRYEKVKKELDDLILKKKDVEGKLDRARTEADEANSRLSKLSKSLVRVVMFDGLIK
jgi:chromosome segregation ATPase